MRAKKVVRHNGEIKVRHAFYKGGCCNKKAYTTQKRAKEVANCQKERSGETIHAFHCLQCHCWHIGHPPDALRGPERTLNTERKKERWEQHVALVTLNRWLASEEARHAA